MFAIQGRYLFKSRFPRKNRQTADGGLVYRGEMLALSEGDKSYLAGLIDGEGCIFIAKHHPKGHTSPVYNMHLIISMTAKGVLEHCRSMTGYGSITCQSRDNNPNWNPYYRWTVNKSGAYRLLTQIKDLLILKRAQAETAIEFMQLESERSGRYGVVSDYVNQKREELRLRLKAQKKVKHYERPIIEEKISETQLTLF